MHHVRLVAPILISALAFLAAACSVFTTDESAEQSSESSNEATQMKLNEQGTTPAEKSVPSSPATAGPVRVETTVVASGLEVPWGLAFLPNGDALLSERDSGRVLRVDSSGNTEEVQRLPEGGSGEGGLLGIALSPDYERDSLVYAYYTTATDNRVVRFRLGEEPEPILTGIPVARVHNGGRIAFGPDGLLYVG